MQHSRAQAEAKRHTVRAIICDLVCHWRLGGMHKQVVYHWTASSRLVSKVEQLPSNWNLRVERNWHCLKRSSLPLQCTLMPHSALPNWDSWDSRGMLDRGRPLSQYQLGLSHTDLRSWGQASSVGQVWDKNLIEKNTWVCLHALNHLS